MSRSLRACATLAAGVCFAASAAAVGKVSLDHLAQPDYASYWFAYVHYDPFKDRYMLDGVAPSRDTKLEGRALAGSEILAISRDGTRVQPVYVKFEYRYNRALEEVVDDPANRVVTAYPCSAPDAGIGVFKPRHPCGSRFTKPARANTWPTFASARTPERGGILSSFAEAIPNAKELERALVDTGLQTKLTEVPAKMDLTTRPSVYELDDPLLFESGTVQYKLEKTRFLSSGVAAPTDAKIVLRSSGNLFGSTTVDLADVRRLRIDTKPGQCPMVMLLMKSGEKKQFTRCDGSTFQADVDGRTVELEQLQAVSKSVLNARMRPSEETIVRTFWLSPYPALLKTATIPTLTSLSALTAEESSNLERP